MPKAWTAKDERKYEHIKDGYEKEGKSEATAEEIAARTVNKDRRLQGRTPNKRTRGTGNPNTPISERSRDELYNIAKTLGLKGRSKMTKAELVQKLSK